MKQLLLAIFISLFVFSCGGGSGEDKVKVDNNSTNSPGSTLVRSTALTDGAECDAGGVQIESGIDVNTNGKLDNNEIDVTKVICNGATGYNSLIKIDDEDAGENCAAGGKSINAGKDLNRNDALDANEIDDTQYVCNGLDGVTGEPGEKGADGTDVTESSCAVTDNNDGTKTISCADGSSITISDGTTGANGKDGSSCSVENNDNGTKTISCSNGSSVVISNGVKGSDGSSCSVNDNNNGTKTISCTDGSSVVVSDGTMGATGADGSSCSVADNGDGTKTISCTDGSSVLVSDGENGASGSDGSSCTVVENNDGTKTISCTDGSSVTISDGLKGNDGSSCSAADNGDNSKTISCTDGSSVVVSDGTMGATGADGSSCSVADNGDGTKTISCTDGSSVLVSDGAKGADGSSCSVTDNNDGTKTISCTDGSSVTVSDGATGASGEDGNSCSVNDNGDGSKTINCTDGSSVFINDGAPGVDGDPGLDGTDGSSCSVADNGDGTKTISCTDGSSVLVIDGVSAIPRQPVFTHIVDCPTGDATIYWNPDDTPSAVSFNLYWRKDPNQQWNQYGPISIEPPNYKHTNRDLSKSYEYFLVASNSRGESLPSPPFNTAKYCLGDTSQTPSVNDSFQSPVMVVIPAEKFVMGDEGSSLIKDFSIGNLDEAPIHQVKFTKPFMISETEITFNEYDLYLRNRPNNPTNPDQLQPYEPGGDNEFGRGSRPAINISWIDAHNYINWLNNMTGLTDQPDAYRLPSEAEWEYAARAENQRSAFGLGDGKCLANGIQMLANYNGTYSWDYYNFHTHITGHCPATNINLLMTTEVKNYPPNAWGLYDMHGNAIEWVEDCYDSYILAPKTGESQTECLYTSYSDIKLGDQVPETKYVRRGGSFQSHGPSKLRSAARYPMGKYGFWQNGFRLARTLPIN